MPPSPIVAATLQATGLSMASNICAQFVQAYQEQVRPSPPNEHFTKEIEAGQPNCLQRGQISSLTLELAFGSHLGAILTVTPELTYLSLQRAFSLDLLQLIRFMALSLMTAPPNFHWQGFLERSFPAYPLPAQGEKPPGLERPPSDVELKPRPFDEPSRLEDGTPVAPEPKFSMRNTLTKWFVDCITMGAIMNTAAFLILMGTMKGQGLGQIWYNIKTVRLAFRPVFSLCFFHLETPHERVSGFSPNTCLACLELHVRPEPPRSCRVLAGFGPGNARRTVIQGCERETVPLVLLLSLSYFFFLAHR